MSTDIFKNRIVVLLATFAVAGLAFVFVKQQDSYVNHGDLNRVSELAANSAGQNNLLSAEDESLEPKIKEVQESSDHQVAVNELNRIAPPQSREEIIQRALNSGPVDPYQNALSPELNADGLPLLKASVAYIVERKTLEESGYQLVLDYPEINQGDEFPMLRLLTASVYQVLDGHVGDGFLGVELPEVVQADKEHLLDVDFNSNKSIPKKRYLFRVE